jgi:hypothetical protein
MQSNYSLFQDSEMDDEIGPLLKAENKYGATAVSHDKADLDASLEDEYINVTPIASSSARNLVVQWHLHCSWIPCC